ncbi:hypothetical protein DESC_120121 [Desulfosarcina cetonica]|nr:hypothetical protein DESC_120121 [Desulfosarcina cetonica]
MQNRAATIYTGIDISTEMMVDPFVHGKVRVREKIND